MRNRRVPPEGIEECDKVDVDDPHVKLGRGGKVELRLRCALARERGSHQPKQKSREPHPSPFSDLRAPSSICRAGYHRVG